MSDTQTAIPHVDDDVVYPYADDPGHPYAEVPFVPCPAHGGLVSAIGGGCSREGHSNGQDIAPRRCKDGHIRWFTAENLMLHPMFWTLYEPEAQ